MTIKEQILILFKIIKTKNPNLLIYLTLKMKIKIKWFENILQNLNQMIKTKTLLLKINLTNLNQINQLKQTNIL